MELYITLDVYTAIMKNCLLIACVAQWVEHMNIAQFFFKHCVVSLSPLRDIYFVFIFYKIFSFFATSFLHFVYFDLIGDKNILLSDL